MAKRPESRFSRFLNKVKINNDRLESPSLHQPLVEDKVPPRVVRPSRTFAYHMSRASKKPVAR